MLRKLHIQNFKGWKDTGMFDLAPITAVSYTHLTLPTSDLV